jgi:hypothetical protein
MHSKLRPREPRQAGISIGNASELCDNTHNSESLMKAAKILLLAGLTGIIAVNLGFAQTWTQTSAPSNLWSCVASSADGTKLFASVIGGGIWRSQDSGATWTQSSAPQIGWSKIVCSADGNILFGVGDSFNGGNSRLSFCASTNSGLAWTLTIMSTNLPSGWSSLVCSADGSKMAARFITNSTPLLCTSSDFGARLVTSILTNVIGGAGICSADGNRLVVVGGSSYISTNGGVGWVVTNSIPDYASLAYLAGSADGMRLIGSSLSLYLQGYPIYISRNGGFAWTRTTAPYLCWMALASSADGSKLAAVGVAANPMGSIGPGIPQPIYTSTNSGVTWKSNNAPTNYWKSIASSADGNKLVAAIEYYDEGLKGGGIWTSQSKPAPSMQITPTNSKLALSWTVPSTNFVLQQSADLSGWADLTNRPALNLTNLQNEVFLPMSGSGGYYRLKTP